jgi:hypothetical protein
MRKPRLVGRAISPHGDRAPVGYRDAVAVGVGGGKRVADIAAADVAMRAVFPCRDRRGPAAPPAAVRFD